MKNKNLIAAKQLSRTEMKAVKGGDGSCATNCLGSCTFANGDPGTCRQSDLGMCYCASGGGGGTTSNG
jgi:hypothetical protein